MVNIAAIGHAFYICYKTQIFAGIPALPPPLPAAVQIPVLDTVIQTDRLNRGMLSIRPTKGMSPHLLMGK